MRSLGSCVHFSARHHAITREVVRQPARFLVGKTNNKHGGMRLTSSNFVFTQFSELFATLLIFTFENIHPSGNFKCKNNILLNRCAGMEKKIVMLISQLIIPAINLFHSMNDTTCQVCFVLFTRQVSASVICDTLLLPLRLLTIPAKRKHQSQVLRLYFVELHALLSSRLPSCVHKV